jgi:DNA-binding cell septation regulator SpoVG
MKLNTNTTIIPNFFKKEHIESMIDRKITKEEFQDYKYRIEENLADEISSIVRDELEFYEEEKMLQGVQNAKTIN